MTHISEVFKAQLSTTVTDVPKALRTTVPTNGVKGTDYAKIDSLYSDLSDLVNDKFHLWYCHMFYKLGYDETMRLASIVRQKARTDKRRYFSWALKNPGKVK